MAAAYRIKPARCRLRFTPLGSVVIGGVVGGQGINGGNAEKNKRQGKTMEQEKTKESRHEKFVRIAAARTNRALTEIRKIGNCASRGSYEYSEVEVEQMFSTLESELAAVKAMFAKPTKAVTLFTFADNTDTDEVSE